VSANPPDNIPTTRNRFAWYVGVGRWGLPVGVLFGFTTFAQKYGLSWQSVASIECLVYMTTSIFCFIIGGYLFGVTFWHLSGRGTRE
jgi:hypothetical protein